MSIHFRHHPLSQCRRAVFFLSACLLLGCNHPDSEITPPPAPTLAPRLSYPLHRDITATIFWVGEPPARQSPSNAASAWDSDWETHFGGFDDPRHRHGFNP